MHFVGDPFARTIYVTEGLLKADIAHLLMERSFVAIAGANNVSRLSLLFALLARNGTELIVEAHDMDKYSNEAISKGASKIFFLAQEHGMQCSRLTWNPNYKGVDDWQLAVRRKEALKKETESMDFKARYLSGLCGLEEMARYLEDWYKAVSYTHLQVSPVISPIRREQAKARLIAIYSFPSEQLSRACRIMSGVQMARTVFSLLGRIASSKGFLPIISQRTA